MKIFKYLIPFLAVVLPTSHKIINNQGTPNKNNLNDSSIDTSESENLILQRSDSEAQRFLLFAKHSSHRSHSSHSSHKSHSSGQHSSHYSGSGSCSGCEFNVDDEYVDPDAVHNVIEDLLK